MTRQPWLLTRKHLPSVGGMQRLSFELVSGLRALRPVKVLAWGRGQWGLPLFLIWAFARMVPALLRGRVSVVHLGDPVLAVLAWLPRLFRVPVAVTVHGLDITWPFRPYQAYLQMFFWGRVQADVCISRHVRELVLAAGVPAKQVLVIPVGVGESGPPGAEPELEARLRGAPLVMLSLGRLVERKGLHWLLREVAPDFFRTHPDAVLVIAGDGPMRPALESIVASSSLASRVLLVGAVSELRKAWLLDRCDLVLMPNIEVPGDAEGFGLVALEAGCAGRWVVVANLEGLRDAVAEDGNGVLLPAADAAAWIAALDQAYADPGLLRRKGAEARDFVRQNYSWPSVVGKYDCLLRMLEADGS